MTKRDLQGLEYMRELAQHFADIASQAIIEKYKTPAQVDKCTGNVTPDDTSSQRVAPQPYWQHDEKRILCDKTGVFADAVMNWISEATSMLMDVLPSGGQSIMASACQRCWDAYGQQKTIDHDAEPATIAPADCHAPRDAADCDSVGNDKAEPLTRDRGTGNTPEPHTTPREGSVPTERTVGEELGSRLRKMNDAIEREPVAWAVMIGAAGHYNVYDTAGEAEVIAQWLRDDDEDDWKAVPLYAHPPQDRVVRLPESQARVNRYAPGGVDYIEGWSMGVADAKRAMDEAGVNWRFV